MAENSSEMLGKPFPASVITITEISECDSSPNFGPGAKIKCKSSLGLDRFATEIS